jgi:hypothetical protein
MLPVAVPQVVGFALLLLDTTGVGLTITLVVTGEELQLLTVIFTLYVPASDAVAEGTVSVAPVTFEPPGVVHVNVAPVADEAAVILIVLPEQIGELLLTIVGVRGGVGSVIVKGPTTLEVQLFNVTETLEYVPANKFGITKEPEV